MRSMLSICVWLAGASLAFGQAPEGYYRFPALHDDVVVFTAEGDLWRAPVEGGLARRLTTHASVESHAAISSDGATLAFSARYEGPTEVYSMPLAGGRPTRHTYDGQSATVRGWTPDGKILYSTSVYSSAPETQLVAVDPDTGAPTRIPLYQASDGSYDASGETLFFTRLTAQGDATKRYKGGSVEDLWKFTDGADEAEPLTADYLGASRDPMWYDGRVYFSSDRDGTMNLWSMKEGGSDLQQHTEHVGWDALTPSLHAGRIAYQLGADLRLYDIEADADAKVHITLASDLSQTHTKWVRNPMSYISGAHLSPDGDRVVLTSRGRAFVAPVKQGRLAEVTRRQGVHYRSARFIDADNLVLLSDETGEMEFARAPADGIGEPELLTSDGEVFRGQAIPAPDGKRMAYADHRGRLWIYEIDSRNQTQIASLDRGGFGGLAWSPDSLWLAFTQSADNGYMQIQLYSVESTETTALTSDRVHSHDPTWDPDGEWLYFASDRDLNSTVGSPWGWWQPDPHLDRTDRLYMISLQEDLRSPFEPDDELYLAKKKAEADEEEDDEDEDGEEEEDGENTESESADADEDDEEEDVDAEQDGDGAEDESDGDEGDDEDVVEPIEIDLDGIQQRLIQIPVPRGRYGSVTANEDHLFWTSFVGDPERKMQLMSVKLDNEKIEAKTLVSEIAWYELSRDGKKLLVRKGETIHVVDANGSPPDDLSKLGVDLGGWAFAVEPREEWRQIFLETWRLNRDFFYDPNMHGVDWEAMREKHLPLVERVTDRDELNHLIRQMVGELSALHVNSSGGDVRRGATIQPASLGAVLQRDEAAGGYRVEHIYETDPEYPTRVSPLRRPGVGIDEGDVISAINGVPILSAPNPAALLANQAGRQVRLRARTDGDEEARDVIVRPMSSWQRYNLRYDEWEYTRRRQVEEFGESDIGYVHLRAMGGGNFGEWARDYYPVFNRKGLIIDARYNYGGNIDSWILGKLLRQAWFFFGEREMAPQWAMQYAFRGHVVVLCNSRTYSNGETLTEGIRRLGIGKVIGTRTWGGAIWLSGIRTVDNGSLRIPQSGTYGPEGEWLIEGHGIDPDIVVDNLPHATFNGQDAQLEAAIQYLQQQIKENPVEKPVTPPFPDKSFEYNRR